MTYKIFKNINYKAEVLAGLTVAMTMIPESLSFAILAGLTPLTGLYAAFLMGLITAILGGRPAMVSGGAGATVITLIALASMHGVEYLFAAVILAGLLQIMVGVLKWCQYIRLVPQPVMYGFLNGLAVVIFMAQVTQFQMTQNDVTTWLTGLPLYIMLALTMLTIGIVFVFPKITRAFPPSLIAIIVIFVLVYSLNIETKKVVDIANVSGALPTFHIPAIPLTWETLMIILPFSLIMACVGLLESLLTLKIVDEITDSKGNTRQESIAQGIANITNGFFGGMGGCAMIAQTLINLKSGARSRLSGIIASLTILLVILIGAPLIEQIPMAALIGVMMMVAISTFKWISFNLITKMPKGDIVILFTVTTIVIITHNLALAVLVGVIMSALIFVSKNRIEIEQHTHTNDLKTYTIYGPLFFGSTNDFISYFTPQTDPKEIIINFQHSTISDMSAIEALNKVCLQYRSLGKSVSLTHVSRKCQQRLQKSKLFNAVSY